MKTVLNVTGLSFSYGGYSILDNVNLSVREGELVLLRGENGSGKTTLINLLTGHLEPLRGTIEVDGAKNSYKAKFPRAMWSFLNVVDRFTPERLSWSGISRSWQDLRLFTHLNLAENVAFGKYNKDTENPVTTLVAPARVRKNAKRGLLRAKNLLAKIALDHKTESMPSQISLGQAKKVVALRAINAGARVLFLDEPLSGLDLKGREEILTFLHDMASKHKVALVIVEHIHNIPRVLKVVDTVWTLEKCRIDAQTVQTALSCPSKPPVQDVVSNIIREADTMIDMGKGAFLHVKRNASIQGKPVLEVKDYCVKLGDMQIVGECTNGIFSGVTFTLFEGDRAVLSAPNGWGKSTLLWSFAGLIPANYGSVRLKGQQIGTNTPWQIRNCGLGLLRSSDHGFSNLAVKDVLKMAGVHSLPPSIEAFIKRPIGSLSGGQRRRVEVHSVLDSDNVSIALLDEPLGALDEQVHNELSKRIENSQKTILISEPSFL